MLDIIKVRVPATSANLGPGFDCLGMALNIYASFTLKLNKNEQNIRYKSNPSENKKNNLAIDCYWLYGKITGKALPRPSIHVVSDIPSTRGLGSSAAFAIGGAIMASIAAGDLIIKGNNEFLPALTAERSSKLRVVMDMILEVAAKSEGHPDNAAPALWGGLVASRTIHDEICHVQLPVSDKLEFVIFVPDFKMRTSEARKVLPEKIVMADASANLAYQAFLLEGLRSGRGDLISAGMKDKLHQPYRFPLIQGAEQIIEMAKKAGALGCTISGAGPSLMCILENKASLNDFIKKMSLPQHWSLKVPGINNTGVSITRIN